MIELQGVLRILAAALGGAAVGVERQWSGHAAGPTAHFAGVRTFTLLGGLAGLAGWLWTANQPAAAVILLSAAAALVVVAYAAASRYDVDGTTEVAAIVVLAAGTIAGLGYITLASGVIAVTCLLLIEKSTLHAWVARLDDEALRAGARFAVMAVVILPLLPEGPFGPLGGVKPRELWALVLFFSGLSFAGYIARRVAGAAQGYPIAGVLGGLVSSTSVTLNFARASRREVGLGKPLAFGVLAACTVMLLRVLIATIVLNPAVAMALVPYLAGPFLVGAAMIVIALTRGGYGEGETPVLKNPLQIRAALEMAVLFQFVLFAVYAAGSLWGRAGLLVSGAVLGLTDLDALTISMAKSASEGIPAEIAARAVAIGILSNTLLKLAVTLAVGRAEFRRLATATLAAVAAVSAASIVLLP